MTSQISDTFIIKKQKYELIGIDGGVLVNPEQFGMVPTMIHTACYRGYFATYELKNSALFLKKLTLSEESGKYVPIDNVLPQKEEYQATYHNLNILVPFTGKLRLAKGFIQKFYVHMGFQKASAFKTVLDFSINNGKIVKVKDRSADAKKMRGEFKKRYVSGDMVKGIDEAFSLDWDIEYAKKDLEGIYQIVNDCRTCNAIMSFNGKPRFGFPPGNGYLAIIVGAEPGPPAKGELTPEQYQDLFAPHASGKNKMQLLFKYIANAGGDWKRFFFTNSVKCPPGANPQENLMQDCFLNCERHLEAQIKAIKPKLIVVVGKAAKRLRLKNSVGSSINNKIDKCPINRTEYKGINTIAVRHPQGASRACMEKIAGEICYLLRGVT